MVDDTMLDVVLSDEALTYLAKKFQQNAEDCKRDGFMGHFLKSGSRPASQEILDKAANVLFRAYESTIPKKQHGVNPTFGDWKRQIQEVSEILNQEIQGLSNEHKAYLLYAHKSMIEFHMKECPVDSSKKAPPDHNISKILAERIAMRSGASGPQATIAPPDPPDNLVSFAEYPGKKRGDASKPPSDPKKTR
jgi:hypothetical protein